MLEIIIFTILIATLLNLFLRQFKIPTIIGYIATGTIIAYGFDLHDAIHNEELKEIAEFGVVFLMFTIGLEFSVKHLIRMKKEVFLYGGLQVFVTAGIFTFFAYYLFNIELEASIIIGAAMALSSTAIVLKLLNENGDINKIYGRKVLGILLFQDIAVIPILLMITLFSIKDASVSSLLFLTFIKAVALIVGLFMAGKYLLEPFFHEVSKTKSNEIFISSILLIVIGSSFLAHQLEFSYSLGAFIAGMMISETKYKHQVEADLIPFRDLLLGVFFVTVGMQLDFRTIYENIITISILLPVLIVMKIAIIFAILRFATNKRNALKSGLALFQLGEFGLVIFELSLAKGLLDPELGQILIITVVISMVLTPFVLKNISQIADILHKKEEETGDVEDIAITGQDSVGHIVLIGFGRLGKRISEEIQKEGLVYIAIEDDIKAVQDAQREGFPVIFGNATQKSILESVNIKNASAVIISLGNSQKLTHVCEVVNELTDNVTTIVKVNHREDRDAISGLNLTHIIVETEKTAAAMFKEVKNCQTS
ncbi:MAG: sodium:proton exchanger [Sulfurovum sp.]|nr:MAG: sodium:proton exchanger [Sulfurovum sp.]